MKKKIYILAFTVLGFLLQFLVHGMVETGYINLLLSDFSKYSLGLSWQQWYVVHHVLSGVLLVGGVLFGFLQGKYWWKQIYELNRFQRFRWLEYFK